MIKTCSNIEILSLEVKILLLLVIIAKSNYNIGFVVRLSYSDNTSSAALVSPSTRLSADWKLPKSVKPKKGGLPGKRSFFTFVTIFCSLIRFFTAVLKELFVHNSTHPIVSYFEPSSQSDEWQWIILILTSFMLRSSMYISHCQKCTIQYKLLQTWCLRGVCRPRACFSLVHAWKTENYILKSLSEAYQHIDSPSQEQEPCHH